MAKDVITITIEPNRIRSEFQNKAEKRNRLKTSIQTNKPETSYL